MCVRERERERGLCERERGCVRKILHMHESKSMCE